MLVAVGVGGAGGGAARVGRCLVNWDAVPVLIVVELVLLAAAGGCVVVAGCCQALCSGGPRDETAARTAEQADQVKATPTDTV